MKSLLPAALVTLALLSAGCDVGPDRPALNREEPQAKEVTSETKRTADPVPDRFFRKWGRTYFSRLVDWRWFKAQATAESNLCPGAVSPAGARGLMQLMPGTSREMAAHLSVPDRPFDPELAVMMGIAYDRRLWDQWTAPRPRLERLRLTFASYNAGLGNLLKAQGLAHGGCDPALWACLAGNLEAVTGSLAGQTIDYVARIESVYQGYGDELE